jgi:anaerobic selenocysteine-containing dehydrogenase
VTTQHVTYCRICEAGCGLLATVTDGRITDIRADKDNPHSQGFMCTKAKAMVDVVYDPDRLLTPMKRVGGPGEFTPCSWDEALDAIASRLGTIIQHHGDSAFAFYIGNPAGGFDSKGPMAAAGLGAAIGSPPTYGVVGEDHGAYVAANALQYGSPALWGRPDLWRCDFLLMAGANPWVSKGSVISEPQIRKAMSSIVERGGRVIVVDPRRTETARQFEHLAIRAGTDAWLFLGLLAVIMADGLHDRQFIETHTIGFETLAEVVAKVDLEQCASRCGIPAAVIADVAKGFGTAGAAAAYGRTGTCTQRFGTLNNLLINSLNIITGNLNKAGGSMFGWGAFDLRQMVKAAGDDNVGVKHTRAGLPVAMGQYPSQSLWRDITEPGEDRIRALCTYSGNPVLNAGAGGERLATALGQLDLHFSIDLYMNETNAHAHYILPAPTFYERSDVPWLQMVGAIRPSLYATEKVIEPRGDARAEWQIFNDIARRMGLGGAYPMKPLRWLSRIGIQVDPIRLQDMAIRMSPVGDRFGLRRKGWSLKKLRKHPHGVSLARHLPVQDLEKILATPDKRIHLGVSELVSEVDRLIDHVEPGAYPLRAIGLREIRSHNSWMHNSPRLTPDGRHPTILVNPVDAGEVGVVADGQEIEVVSASGSITMPVVLTHDMAPGTVAIPHGWGHAGGWHRANAAGGANANVLVSVEDADIEPIAAMSILNGIPVRLRSPSRVGDRQPRMEGPRLKNMAASAAHLDSDNATKAID